MLSHQKNQYRNFKKWGIITDEKILTTKHNNLKRCVNFRPSFDNIIEDILGTTEEI